MLAVPILQENGQRLKFYMPPCAAKKDIRQLLQDNGGNMVASWTLEVIFIADPGVPHPRSARPMYDSKWIIESVKEGRLLPKEDYRVVSGVSVPVPSQQQRFPYTKQEDAAILDFLSHSSLSVTGNEVWKEMESKNVTRHSWQSMKGRYKGHLAKKHIDDEETVAALLAMDTQVPLEVHIDPDQLLDDVQPVENDEPPVKMHGKRAAPVIERPKKRDPVALLQRMCEKTGTSINIVMRAVFQCSGDLSLAERVIRGDIEAPWDDDKDAKLMSGETIQDVSQDACNTRIRFLKACK